MNLNRISTVALLVSILFLVFVLSKYKIPKFKQSSTLLQVDTLLVDKIVCFPPVESFQKVVFEKNAGSWSVTKQGVTVKIPSPMVSLMLSKVVAMKSKQKLTKDTAMWTSYGLGKNDAAKVLMYSKEKEVANFSVGKFVFNSKTKWGSTSVRLKNKPDVYEVEDYMVVFNQKTELFRYDNILVTDSTQLSKLVFDYEGSQDDFSLEKKEKEWLLNGKTIDASTMQNYISVLSYLFYNQNFVDDFDVTKHEAKQKLLIHTGTKVDSIRVFAPLAQHSKYKYLLQSSQNPSSIFGNVGEKGLYGVIFKKKQDFL